MDGAKASEASTALERIMRIEGAGAGAGEDDNRVREPNKKEKWGFRNGGGTQS